MQDVSQSGDQKKPIHAILGVLVILNALSILPVLALQVSEGGIAIIAALLNAFSFLSTIGLALQCLSGAGGLYPSISETFGRSLKWIAAQFMLFRILGVGDSSAMVVLFIWAAADLVVLGTARVAKAELSDPIVPKPSPSDIPQPAAAPVESRLSTEI